MTLAASGAISLGGSTATRSVNLELNLSATAQISFNDAAVRTLTGTSANTALIMPTNFYGKSLGATVTVGNYIVISKISTYNYGYDGATGGTASNFGSIADGTFSGATIKAVYSASFSSGQATTYTVIFSGNRAGGFFNSLTIGGTLAVGSIGSPVYSAGNDETTFVLTLTSTAATLFGTVDGVTKLVVIT